MCVCAGGRSAGREGEGREGKRGGCARGRWGVCKGSVHGVWAPVFTGVQLGNRLPITNNATCLLHTSDAMEEAPGFSN